MTIEYKTKEAMIEVGGERLSIEYCWQDSSDGLRLIVRYANGKIEVIDDAPPTGKTDASSTLDIIQFWASTKYEADKYVFVNKLKGK